MKTWLIRCWPGTEAGLLTGIIAVSVLLRVIGALWQGNSVTDLPGIYDQLSYHGLAQRVANGYGFSFAEGHWPATPAGEPTAHWSYIYTLYLSVLYFLFGVQPLLARLIQAVAVGLLHPWLAWRVGRRMFGSAAGIFGAAFTAVYAYFVYYAGGLLTEAFYFVALLWTIDVAIRMVTDRRARERRGPWLELGLAVGLSALLRQVFLLCVPFLFMCLWLSLPEEADADHGRVAQLLRWRTLKHLALSTLIIALLILPWSIRNYRAFGTFVLLNTSAGFAFYWGNHPIQGTHFIPLLPATGPSYGDLIPARLRALNEGQLDRALLREGLRIVRADPGRFIKLSLSRVQEYFKFWPSSESGLLSNVARVGSFGLFLPLMVYGVGLALTRVRRPTAVGQRPAILLTYVFMCVYATAHLLSWTLIRYRLPIDVILLIFAGFATTDLIGRMLRKPGLPDTSVARP